MLPGQCSIPRGAVPNPCDATPRIISLNPGALAGGDQGALDALVLLSTMSYSDRSGKQSKARKR